MNACHDETSPIAVATSFKTRLAIHAVSGALAGLLFLAPASILLQLLLLQQWHQPWLEAIDYWSPLGGQFWRFVWDRSEVFMGGSFFGLVGGAITSIFSDRTRHPIALASLWAFIWTTPGLVVQPFLHDLRSMDFALSIALCVIMGAGYGFLLGIMARVLEQGLERRRLQRIALTASLEPR